MRFLLLTILNLSLPFILRGIYIYGVRLYQKRQQNKGIKNITPKEWHFPVRQLLLIGLLLLLATLGGYRILGVEQDKTFSGNIVKSGNVD